MEGVAFTLVFWLIGKGFLIFVVAPAVSEFFSAVFLSYLGAWSIATVAFQYVRGKRLFRSFRIEGFLVGIGVSIALLNYLLAFLGLGPFI